MNNLEQTHCDPNDCRPPLPVRKTEMQKTRWEVLTTLPYPDGGQLAYGAGMPANRDGGPRTFGETS